MVKGGMTVIGLEAAVGKVQQVSNDLHGPPMMTSMKAVALKVTREAKINAPKDRSRLAASIRPEVRLAAFAGSETVQGVIMAGSTNVTYAPYQEFGTRPFWPPLSALEVWARRHGTTAYVVARAISRRGIRATRFLQRALESSADYIYQKIGVTVAAIVMR